MSDFGVGYDVEIRGLDEQLKKIAQFEAIAQPELEHAMTNVVGLVEREAKKLAPVGVTGNLKSAISGRVIYASGTDVRGKVGVGDGAPYGAAVELGARPHFPPVSNIAYWVDRKIGVRDGMEIYGIALAVARKIARAGQKPHPFMKPALEKVQDRIVEQFRSAADRILKKLEVK